MHAPCPRLPFEDTETADMAPAFPRRDNRSDDARHDPLRHWPAASRLLRRRSRHWAQERAAHAMRTPLLQCALSSPCRFLFRLFRPSPCVSTNVLRERLCLPNSSRLRLLVSSTVRQHNRRMHMVGRLTWSTPLAVESRPTGRPPPEQALIKLCGLPGGDFDAQSLRQVARPRLLLPGLGDLTPGGHSPRKLAAETLTAHAAALSLTTSI